MPFNRSQIISRPVQLHSARVDVAGILLESVPSTVHHPDRMVVFKVRSPTVLRLQIGPHLQVLQLNDLVEASLTTVAEM